MEAPQELREQYVFSRKVDEDESTVMTYQSASSGVGSPADPIVPQSTADALAAAGLLGGFNEAPRFSDEDEPRTRLPLDEEIPKSTERSATGDAVVSLPSVAVIHTT